VHALASVVDHGTVVVVTADSGCVEAPRTGEPGLQEGNSMDDRSGVHLVVGGFPPGTCAAHDMDYARVSLLQLLAEREDARTTVSSDFDDLPRWLDTSRLLVTYVAGPYPDPRQNEQLRQWLHDGGRWLALHGTSGGKAARVERDGRQARAMVRLDHHDTLGCFFLNHPPIRRIELDVNVTHPLADGLPATFDVNDELYFIELLQPADTQLVLTTQLPADPLPGFGFAYERDTSLFPDGRTRALAYTRSFGKGEVAYFALGHCHSPVTNSQPFVDKSVTPDGRTPLTFRGSWTSAPFLTLLRNTMRWGVSKGA